MTRTVREAPGVARLRSEEQRTRPTRGLVFMQLATDPFLSQQQEHDLFVELKRQGKVRAKAGFGDIGPYLAAYKDAVRRAALEPSA